MRAPRRTATAALVLVALIASPSVAAAKKPPPPKKLPASKPLVFTDKAGDANGLNGQGVVTGVEGTATPTQYSGADILTVSLNRLDDTKTVLGFQVTYTLSGAPAQGTIYRVMVTTPACPTFWLSYNYAAGGTPLGNLRNNCADNAVNVNTPLTVTATDSSVTILLPFKDLPQNVKLGDTLTVKTVETRGHASTVTAPTIDDLDPKLATWKIG